MVATAAVELVAVDRAGLREATHNGHLVVSDAAGSLRTALGDPDRPTYYRSSAKPLQALAMLRIGVLEPFALNPEQIAIMCASHNGEPRHVEMVRSLLAAAQVPEATLQCGAHWPYSEEAAQAARRQMAEPIAVFNNCSGKHAGMLAASVVLDAPIDRYLDPEHPVQERIRAVIEEFTGCAASEIAYGTDGCSAPNPAVPLRAIARSLAGLAASADALSRTIVDAMTAHPFLVGGTGRFDTRLMEVTRGRLLAKGGAAGLHCTVDRERKLALAAKFETGDGTWIGVAVMAALEQLGWLRPDEVEALAEFGRPVVRNYRRIEVGKVRAIFQLPPR